MAGLRAVRSGSITDDTVAQLGLHLAGGRCAGQPARDRTGRSSRGGRR
jgi:hypothetical protein